MKANPPEVASVIGLVDTYLRWKDINKPPRGYKHYHPSAFGHCSRHMQYCRYAEEKVPGVEMRNKELLSKQIRVFDSGHSMHSRWREYMEGVGILKGVWECTNPYCLSFSDHGKFLELKEGSRKHGKNELRGVKKPERCECGNTKFNYHEVAVESKELNFYGHADMVVDFSLLNKDKFKNVKLNFDYSDLPDKDIVIDMKTIKNDRFTTVAREGPSIEYKMQLIIYSNILDCKFGLLIYENKDTSEILSFKIDRNEEWWEEIQRQAKMMNAMAEVKDKDGNRLNLLPPPRPLRKDSYECRFCEFQKTCVNSGIWDNPKLRELRNKFYGKTLE